MMTPAANVAMAQGRGTGVLGYVIMFLLIFILVVLNPLMKKNMFNTMFILLVDAVLLVGAILVMYLISIIF